MTNKYSKGSQDAVRKEMHEYKHGEAHIGKSSHKVKDPKQAIAIGLSKARKNGEHVPKKKG